MKKIFNGDAKVNKSMVRFRRDQKLSDKKFFDLGKQ